MPKGLIIAPGLDKWQAEYSIKEIAPTHVAFLTTEATTPLVEAIKAETNIRSSRNFYIKDIFSTVETIQEFFNALHWISKDCGVKDIWVDATNCITVVEMATYTSASLVDIFKDVLEETVQFNLVYVHCDYEIKQDGIAGEVRGTERLVELEKPIDTLSFVLALDGIISFNNHRYAEAEKIFMLLSKNTSGEKSILYEALFLLSAGYNCWDKLKINEAKENLEKAKAATRKVRQFELVRDISASLEKNIDALDHLQNGAEPKIVLDLYANALRREKEERFDDALARLYACMEKITQYQLKKYGIISASPDYSKLDNQTVEQFEKKLGFLPQELELKKNALLLMLLNDGIGQQIEKTGYRIFLGLIGIRNNSILAHGTKPVSHQNFLQFKEKLADPILEKFILLNGIEKKELDDHSHMKLLELTRLLLKRTQSPLK